MRPELWEKRAAFIAPFSGVGISADEVSRRTGISAWTVRRCAERFSFDFSIAAAPDVLSDLRRLAEAGKTRKEASADLGVPYQTVVRYALDHDIKFISASLDPSASEKAEVMAAMFKGGRTMESIGAVYGITRERVRQILKKRCGLTGQHGGVTASKKRRADAVYAKKDADCLKRHGCTYAQYRELSKAVSGGRSKTPTGAFIAQRRSARNRGISWNMKLWDWWQVWEQSGKWEMRGRTKDRYVMCRFRDEGGYEPGNVYIATSSHNASFQPNNPSRVSHPDHHKYVARLRQQRSSTHSTHGTFQ